jgi:hypothetical protein
MLVRLKWSSVLTWPWGYRRNLMPTVDLDRLKVISSGSVLVQVVLL